MTSAKALSTIASTACFDKHPESKERGITLDLGEIVRRVQFLGLAVEIRGRLVIPLTSCVDDVWARSVLSVWGLSV